MSNSGTYICRSSDEKIASLVVTVLVGRWRACHSQNNGNFSNSIFKNKSFKYFLFFVILRVSEKVLIQLIERCEGYPFFIKKKKQTNSKH